MDADEAEKRPASKASVRDDEETEDEDGAASGLRSGTPEKAGDDGQLQSTADEDEGAGAASAPSRRRPRRTAAQPAAAAESAFSSADAESSFGEDESTADEQGAGGEDSSEDGDEESGDEESGDEESGDEESDDGDAPAGEDVEKILGHRVSPSWRGMCSAAGKDVSSLPEGRVEFEYLVKRKGMSHRHSEWRSKADLADDRWKRVERYRRQHHGFMRESCDRRDTLLGTFATVERILDVRSARLKNHRMRFEESGCEECGAACFPDSILVCDACEREYHLGCLKPPLQAVPEGDWFCPQCAGGVPAKEKEDTLGALPAHLLEMYAALRGELPEGHCLEFLCKWEGVGYASCTWEVLDAEAYPQDTDAAAAFFARQRRLQQPLPRAVAPRHAQFAPLLTKDTIPLENGMELRDYQVEGVNWLLNHWEYERSSLLADEMGLGKTLQAVAFLATLSKLRKQPGPYLVVAPLSTLVQWRHETERWTELTPVVLHGVEEDRRFIKERELHRRGDRRSRPSFDVLITSYEMLMAEANFLARFDWTCVVVDEAQRLKNAQSHFYDLTMSRPGLRGRHRVLLTGTPIQNSVEELYNLLLWMNPQDERFCGQREAFLETYASMKDAGSVASLQELLKGYLLRRLKGDVEKDLPRKIETIVEVELTSIQKQYYRAILESNRKFLNRGLRASDQPSLINIFMQLRKLCNHPFLIDGARERLLSGDAQVDTFESVAGEPMDPVMASPLVASSGKLILLHKLICKFRRQKQKVLIFSQLVIMLDIIAEYLQDAGFGFARLDGRVSQQKRQAGIERFRSDPDTFVFLISTRAGGVGLNLQTASNVILFDSDWNPQNDLQAQARTHRIGQTRDVKVYRLVTRKTYEQHILRIAGLKMGLDAAVLGSAGGAGGGMSSRERAREVEKLLREGSFELLSESDDVAKATARAFAETKIDAILETAREVDAPGQQSTSRFSKAKFVASNCDEAVDIDDEDFWLKMLPDSSSLKVVHAALSILVYRLRAALRKAAEDLPSLPALSALLAFWAARLDGVSATNEAKALFGANDSPPREKGAQLLGGAIMPEADARRTRGAEASAELIAGSVEALARSARREAGGLPPEEAGAPAEQAPALKAFLQTALGTLRPVREARADGETPEETQDALFVLRIALGLGIFAAVEGAEGELLAAFRAIDKPKRRRRSKVGSLAALMNADEMEDAPYNAEEEGSDASAASERRKKHRGDAGERVLAWADAAKAHAAVLLEKRRYGAKALPLISAIGKMNENMKAHLNRVVAATSATEAAVRARADARRRAVQEAAERLRLMLFLPPACKRETQKAMAPRAPTLVMRPPSAQLPVDSAYCVFQAAVQAPRRVLVVHSASEKWATVTSKVTADGDTQRMWAPFLALHHDLIVGVNGRDVRGLDADVVRQRVFEGDFAHLQLVRFKEVAPDHVWSEVHLVDDSAVICLDQD